MKTKKTYECDSCSTEWGGIKDIGFCPICDKEICENCGISRRLAIQGPTQDAWVPIGGVMVCSDCVNESTKALTEYCKPARISKAIRTKRTKTKPKAEKPKKTSKVKDESVISE